MAVLRHALGSGAASSQFIRSDLDALLHGDYLTSFGLDGICAELDAVVGLAAELEVPFELAGAVRQVYQCALARFGPADGVLLGAALLEEQAGTRLRAGEDQ